MPFCTPGKRRALHSSCPSARVRSTESPIALSKPPTSRIWRPRHRSSLCSRSMLLKLPRFPTANTCYTPKADRFTLTTTRGNGLRPGGLHRICISFKLLIAEDAHPAPKHAQSRISRPRRMPFLRCVGARASFRALPHDCAARNESTKSLQAEVMLTGHGDGGVFERPWTKAYRRCFSTVQPAEIGVTSVTVLERELPENA